MIGALITRGLGFAVAYTVTRGLGVGTAPTTGWGHTRTNVLSAVVRSNTLAGVTRTNVFSETTHHHDT